MSKILESTILYSKLMEKVEKDVGLVDILDEVKDYCSGCEPPTPMTCVETCELWKVKNDYLKLNKILRREGYSIDLFNALKMKKRTMLASSVYRKPLTPEESQKLFEGSEYSSRPDRIVKKLFNPLKEVGIVVKDGDAYRTTFYGKRILDVLYSCENFQEVLKYSSTCYQEFCLMELLEGQRSYEDLVDRVPRKTVSLVVKRMARKGLVKEEGGEIDLTPKGRKIAECLKEMLETKDELL